MSKRAWDDFDPNKSDPEDEDYTASNKARSKQPRQVLSKSKPRRKKQRTGYKEDASEDISDSMLEENSFGEDYESNDDSDDQEINEATGRPVRRSTKNRSNMTRTAMRRASII